MLAHRRAAVTVAVALLALLGSVLTACADPGSGDPKHITVWSLENLSDRFAKTQEIAKRFTAETGITVELQGIDEAQLPQLVVQSAAAGTLPDVIGALPLALVRQLDRQEVADPVAAADVVKRLGENTFAPAALALTRAGDRQLSVPSDAWSQILVYRKDLFERAGLKPPTDYASLLAAAQKLTGDGRFGITLATDPADVFTSQTFEALALGNNCQLTNGAGEVALASEPCRETFALYRELTTKYSPKGTQTVDTTRESYFAGQSAMVLWSTFLLDELAGLRDDALPTCAECKSDPEFLSRNSGVVTTVAGPAGEKAKAVGSFGEITSWLAVSGGKRAASEAFMEYMMSDGYTDWLGLAPEGKYPVRVGDASSPRRFADAWAKLPAGVDRKKPLSEVYDAGTVEQISGVAGSLRRWGIAQGQGDLLGAVTAQLPVAQVVAEMAAGGGSADDAATEARDEVTELQEDLN